MDNKQIEQQAIADTITRYEDPFIGGALNAYELAGKIRDAIQDAEIRTFETLISFGNEERSQTESGAFRLAR
jgi:hypothetical protein